MKSSEYRSVIMLAAAATLSLTGAVYAGVDSEFPAPPELDSGAVHGATALDRAALRAAYPDYGVSSIEAGVIGPLISLDEMEEHPDARREGPWFIHEPTPSQRSLAPRIELATVQVEGESAKTCNRSGKRHACGDAGWQYVGPATVRVQGRDEACIWAHPISESTIVIRYPSVLGGPYRLRFALSDRSIGTGTPVDVAVRYGELQMNHQHPDRRGFTGIELPRVEEPTELELRISADHVGRRHFCYRVEP